MNQRKGALVTSACPETPLPLGGVGGGKDNLLISFTPIPTLPQRERENQSFRTGTNYPPLTFSSKKVTNNE
jgi:hypothetical protein